MSRAVKADLLIFGGWFLPQFVWVYGLSHHLLTAHGSGFYWLYPTFVVMLVCCWKGVLILRAEMPTMSRGLRILQGLVLGIGMVGLCVSVLFSVLGLPGTVMELASKLGY